MAGLLAIAWFLPVPVPRAGGGLERRLRAVSLLPYALLPRALLPVSLLPRALLPVALLPRAFLAVSLLALPVAGVAVPELLAMPWRLPVRGLVVPLLTLHGGCPYGGSSCPC